MGQSHAQRLFRTTMLGVGENRIEAPMVTLEEQPPVPAFALALATHDAVIMRADGYAAARTELPITLHRMLHHSRRSILDFGQVRLSRLLGELPRPRLTIAILTETALAVVPIGHQRAGNPINGATPTAVLPDRTLHASHALFATTFELA